MLWLRRTIGRMRILLAIALAAILIAVPTASYAQAESCNSSGMLNGMHADTATAPSFSAKLHHDHASAHNAAAIHDPARHHDGPKTCCGHTCVFCSAVIMVDAVSVSGPLQDVRHLAAADVPFRGLAVAPPIGPPRFQS